MNAVVKILSRILATIPIKGTIRTPSGGESYPVAISNEIMGGPFIVDNLDELKEIPVERMLRGCKCTVNEYIDGDETIPTRTYVLKTIPSQRLTDLGAVNISDYWILDRPQQKQETAIESQYAADYAGQKPPFLPNILSKAAYNDGYATQADYDASNTAARIWTANFDPLLHKWVRQRTGSLADWGIPVKVDDGYDGGKYEDVRFMWRLNTLGAPARPSSMVDGERNNVPTGWADVPDIPGGIDYTTYIATNTLWRVSSTKDVYGDLLSEWTEPIIISTDPNLVRYGVDANNNDYLNDIYWRPQYSSGDKFRASRITVADPWTVERIAGESGEYIDYVFKEFEDSYEPLPSDAPQTVLGYGINGWKDGVFTSQAGYTLYVSTARKYSDGTISENWTTPARYDGKNTIRCVVVPEENTGQLFKYIVTNGVKVATPVSIKLKAKLFTANVQVPSSEFTSVTWYKGTQDTGTIIAKLPIGTAPNRNAQITGTKDSDIELFPENISNTQVFTAVIVFKGETYADPIVLSDLTDGVGYATAIESDSGFTYKGVETKTFTAKFYENGLDISNAAQVTYRWELNGAFKGANLTTTVTDGEVSGVTNLVLISTINGITYTRTETLTDVSDGKSIDRRYSTLENIDMSHTPDTPGNPSGWSTDSTSAVWVIERIEGGEWIVPYRVRGEKGTPNGAFQKTVYRTRAFGTAPSWLTTRPSPKTVVTSNLVPTDWSETPESNAATGSEIWATKATFVKNPNTDSVEEIVSNWNYSGLGWSLPFKLTQFPAAGDNGAPGTDGLNGWSIIPQLEEYGESRIMKVKDWTGGTGSKPVGTNYYIGTTGLVASQSQALNLRGPVGATGIQGQSGVFNPEDFWYKVVVNATKELTDGRSFRLYMKLAKNGMMYYWMLSKSHNSGNDSTFTLYQSVGEIAEYLPISWVLSSNYSFPLDTKIDVTDTTSSSSFGTASGADMFSIQFSSGSMKIHIPMRDSRLLIAHGSYMTEAATS